MTLIKKKKRDQLSLFINYKAIFGKIFQISNMIYLYYCILVSVYIYISYFYLFYNQNINYKIIIITDIN